MRVVSNTSPLLNLAAIGKVDLLTKLFGVVSAPEVVRDEIVGLRQRDPRFSSADAGNAANFLPVQDRDFVALLSLHLDPGEAESIALALAIKADLLLVDERLATRTAHHFGPPRRRCTGQAAVRCFGRVPLCASPFSC